jgi:dipeptidyl aminopeptidase/acylaminoacyl peptidase
MRQTPRYTIEQFMDTSRVSGISFSHDESSILVSSNQTGIFNVFSVPVTGGPMRQLTFSTGDDIRAVAYFPDDSRILYAHDKGGIESRHLCVLEEDGRHVDLTHGTGIKAGLRRWSRDGKHFYCVTNERDCRYFDVYKIDSDGYERSLLFECDNDDVFVDVSNDERWGLFVRNNSASDSDIYLYDFANRVMQKLTSHYGSVRHHSPYFDLQSRNVFYSAFDDEAASAYRYKLSTGKTHRIGKIEHGCLNERLSYNERYRVVLRQDGVRIGITVYDCLSGEAIALPAFPDGEVKSLTISRSERLMAFYVNGDCAPNDLYVYEFLTGQIRKLTNSLNPAIHPADLVESEEISFTSFDGMEIPCLLWKPHDANGIQKAPALVWVHGGPGGQTRKGYAGAVQFLVNHGYVVLGVNHRGSSGFGKAFEAAADRKQGREPLWDCVEARRFLSTLDFVDDSKIAIMGGSFGAYMTLAALAFHPDEFAAGVAISGVSNWIRALKALPEGSPTRKFYYEKLGDPETDEELLRAISPLFHARNISKPLMVLQGAKDPRVLRAESDDIVAAVRTNGGVVEYLLFDDEAHGFRKRANAVRAYQAILNFLDRHLKYDRSYENFGLEEYVIA